MSDTHNNTARLAEPGEVPEYARLAARARRQRSLRQAGHGRIMRPAGRPGPVLLLTPQEPAPGTLWRLLPGDDLTLSAGGLRLLIQPTRRA